MKNKLFTVGVVLVLIIALGASQALAQGGIVYTSAYQIQNMESSTATVLIQYYDQATGTLTASGTISVPGNGSKTVFPFQTDGISGPSSFNGSAVLSSDKQIAAILNIAQEEIVILKKIVGGYHKQKQGLMQKLLTGKWKVK